MKIEMERAQPADAKRLAEVFNQSFYSDYMKYGECPGYGKTEQGMLGSMKQYQVYKILADGETVGAISVRVEERENHFYLGALCVVPAYAGRGIGQQAMRLLDAEYPNAVHWALETPADKRQNHHFYKKFGYRVTREYPDGSVPICYFERTL